jgi:hypothetical protein
VAEQTSTGRVRRTPRHDGVPVRARSKYADGVIKAVAPQPSDPVIPRGDLSEATVEDICGLVPVVWPGPPTKVSYRRVAVRGLLQVLQELPGRTWQQHWNHSGYAAQGFTDDELQEIGPAATMGLKLLASLRVIRPNLRALRSVPPFGFAEMFRAAQADPALDRLFGHLAAMPGRRQFQRVAALDIVCALTVFGIRYAELDPAGFLHYAWQARQGGLGAYQRGSVTSFSGQQAWRAMIETGHFPDTIPATLQAAAMRGQLTVTELVDRYPLRNTAVRQLLIDYLTRRFLAMDYGSLTGLARWLTGVFWAKIESLSPDQADLKIPGHVYDQWRAAIRLRDDGRGRLSVDPILLAVRSFYLDLHTWAIAEPRWAVWVAPCPIDPGDFVGSARRHRRARERSAERTRTRQPLLPILLTDVRARRDHLHRLLTAAADTEAGQPMRVNDRDYSRVWTVHDQRHADDGGDAPVRVRDHATGQTINVKVAEDQAFWDWAMVETLRLSGIGIEEMLELSQLSVRRYQRPNGETIGLLVIAPSKSDRERVIPMSAELFAVIAAIIRRHTQRAGTVPMTSRYDTHEKIHTPAMPFLFQRRHGHTHRVLGQHSVLQYLQRRCTALADTCPGFGQARFTPHDFRRLFATDVVNNGLPIHIGAALLGHLNLETTRGYVAVFEEDLIRHYQAFLDHRRRTRPTEEYRQPNDTEWAEFEQHFDRRKVELGNCGRPYGTGCTHEHACLRCPMLHVEPDMLPRLDSIEDDLRQRRVRAEAEHWLGEIEGIDITLTRLAGKRDQAHRIAAHRPVPLGMPHPRTVTP